MSGLVVKKGGRIIEYVASNSRVQAKAFVYLVASISVTVDGH